MGRDGKCETRDMGLKQARVLLVQQRAQAVDLVMRLQRPAVLLLPPRTFGARGSYPLLRIPDPWVMLVVSTAITPWSLTPRLSRAFWKAISTTYIYSILSWRKASWRNKSKLSSSATVRTIQVPQRLLMQSQPLTISAIRMLLKLRSVSTRMVSIILPWASQALHQVLWVPRSSWKGHPRRQRFFLWWRWARSVNAENRYLDRYQTIRRTFRALLRGRIHQL